MVEWKALADEGFVVWYAAVIILAWKEENVFFRETSSEPWSELELGDRGSEKQHDRVALTSGEVPFEAVGEDMIQC